MPRRSKFRGISIFFPIGLLKYYGLAACNKKVKIYPFSITIKGLLLPLSLWITAMNAVNAGLRLIPS